MSKFVHKIIRTSTISLSLNVLLRGQLKFLNQFYNIVAVSGHDENLEQVRSREKVKTLSVEMKREISPLKDILSLFNLIRLFNKEKPSIVHSITPKAGLLSMTAAYVTGVPIRMHTFTGLIWPTKSGFIRQLLIVMDKILCKMATHIYPEGEGVKSDLLNHKITRKKLKIIANGNVNGIDLEYFNPNLFDEEFKNNFRSSLNILPTDFVFLFIGRLVKDKGINELVATFNDLESELEADVKLLLVGPFEENLDPLEKGTLDTINSNKNIISVGYQSDVRPFLSIANAFVFPSYREGFPNVVIQAGAFALPSIVTDINGSNEIITNGYNGYIIPTKNKEALKSKMLYFLKNKDQLHSLESNALDSITKNFNQEIVWDALKNEYDLLISQKLE